MTIARSVRLFCGAAWNRSIKKARWQLQLEGEAVLVVYTFVVHPDWLSKGIGQELLDFAVEYGLQTETKALRLDVYEHNLPAIHLYKKRIQIY